MLLELRRIDPRTYAIARCGDTSKLYEELMWFATADDRLLGMILRDKMDADYSWLVFARSRQNQYRAIDLGVSVATLAIAEHKLADALERWNAADDATLAAQTEPTGSGFERLQ
jgi:hypothetical protein